SPMGSRLLKRWVVLPLKDKAMIEHRQQAVGALLEQADRAAELTSHLQEMGDVERMISKIAAQKASPRDVVQLRRSLEVLLPIKELLEADQNSSIQLLGEQLMPCDAARQLIAKTLMDEVPAFIGKGEVIREGNNSELDELRDISKNGKNKLLEIQQREMEKTGITSLKIGFNNVFGYFLEVTNKFKDQVPENWIRKQTLTNSERYITDELKQLEDKILGAEDKILEWEQRLFAELLAQLMPFIEPLQQNAAILAQLDCLLSFARISQDYQYCKPVISEGLELDIKQGRHPVIEQQLPLGESYIPNDVYLHNEDQQIIIITGPNMSGKSAILRQTALIVLMAQMGCYVPAEAATIGLVDKVFTRVGASDNLSMGESTFMVEMLETSSIMNNISDRSLILLDEIGRGTSTYDGISIAWSIAEFLHQNPAARPKTLFATHYHELNELAESHERVRNYHVATKEVGDKVIFLRKLTAGGSQHSFGIHVAKLAGMPKWIVERAQTILGELEQKNVTDVEENKARLKAAAQSAQYQLSIFDTTDPATKAILEDLENLDLNTMTPVEAMLKLSELKNKRKG
nr:DNA mismatch repair protein MutS [Saprospiraceae bacterium]